METGALLRSHLPSPYCVLKKKNQYSSHVVIILKYIIREQKAWHRDQESLVKEDSTYILSQLRDNCLGLLLEK